MRIRFNRFVFLLLAAFAPIVLSGCYTVPVTGRKSMILIDEDSEMRLGATSYAEMRKKTKISTNPAINARVQRVGKRIAAATGRNYDWEFTVFDDPNTVNAFCLPGGKVGIYTGILKVARDNAGLATIIGHEVAHAVARHGAERYSHGMMVGIGGAFLDQALGENGEKKKNKERWQVAYGLGSTLFLALPHSRMQESEADRIGLIYMAKAGYDPRGAVTLWERFKEYKDKHGQTQIEFLSTHPTDERRIRDIKSHLPEAMGYYRAASGKTPAARQKEGTALIATPLTKPARVVPSATMVLKVRCPHCGKVNRVSFSGYHGEPIKCYSCGRTFK